MGKFLEIGLGCDMGYGPGASVQVWKKLLPHAELWEAEYEGECVKKAIEKNQLEGIHTLVGDQGDFNVLDSWIETSGGNFDIIIVVLAVVSALSVLAPAGIIHTQTR